MKIYFLKKDIPILDLILSSLIILNKELSVADDLVKRLLQIDTKDMSKGLNYYRKTFYSLCRYICPSPSRNKAGDRNTYIA